MLSKEGHHQSIVSASASCWALRIHTIVEASSHLVRIWYLQDFDYSCPRGSTPPLTCGAVRLPRHETSRLLSHPPTGHDVCSRQLHCVFVSWVTFFVLFLSPRLSPADPLVLPAHFTLIKISLPSFFLISCVHVLMLRVTFSCDVFFLLF